MAYTPNFPQFYPPQQPVINNPYSVAQTPQNTGNNLVAAYVLGEQNAKSYPVAPGQTAILIDMENPLIYTKTVDQFGRPTPIKILRYHEEVQNEPAQTPNNNFVSKEDFDKFRDEIKEILRQNKPNNFKHDKVKETANAQSDLPALTQ